MYTTYGAVINTVAEIRDLTKSEARFLAAQQVGIDRLNQAHHELEVDATAVLLEKLVKKYDFAGPENDQRRSAIVKVFRWITGYNSLGEAVRSHDRLCFTRQGLRNAMVASFGENEFISQEE